MTRLLAGGDESLELNFHFNGRWCFDHGTYRRVHVDRGGVGADRDEE